MPGTGVALLASRGLADPRGKACPGPQMRRGRELGHVQTDLGDDRLRGAEPDPGDLTQPVHRQAKGAIWISIRSCTVAISAEIALTRDSIRASRNA